MGAFVDIERDCPQKCIYCLRDDDYTDSGKKPMTLEQIIYVIDNLNDYKPLRYINLSGGEPLKNEKSLDKVYAIAEHCREKNIGVGVLTNGNFLHKHPEALDDMYKHVNSIQIGVHDYTKLDSLFNLMERKGENGNLRFWFVINNETKDSLDDVKERIAKFGYKNLPKKKIKLSFNDMIPIGNSTHLALPKYSDVMDDLFDYFRNHGYGAGDAIEVALTRDEVLKDNMSYCKSRMEDFFVDNYGQLRLCVGCYGPVFGSLLDGDIEEIIADKNELIHILETYHSGHVIYDRARELAQKKGVNYAEIGVFCARGLRDLFEEYRTKDDWERMVMDFEKFFSTVPIGQIKERYRKYDLKLWQKRAMQTALSFPQMEIITPDTRPNNLLKGLPPELSRHIKRDMFDYMLEEKPEKITDNIMTGIWSALTRGQRIKAKETILRMDPDGEISKWIQHIEIPDI